MSMTIFLLIRHAAHGHLGQTLSGRMPSIGLSKVGLEQARLLAAHIASEDLALVQHSPVQRAATTARAIAATCAVPLEEVAALDEIDFGDWTGRTFAELDGDPDWTRWNAARGGAAVPGGETMVAAQRRIVGHLIDTAAARPNATIAVVTHCDMIRAAVCWAIGLPLDRLLRFEVDAASITRLSVDGAAARLLTLNEGIG